MKTRFWLGGTAALLVLLALGLASQAQAAYPPEPSASAGAGAHLPPAGPTLPPPLPTATSTPLPTPSATPGPMLVGHVLWQGRPAGLSALPLTLTLTLSSTTTAYPNLTADANGFFTVPVGLLPTGVYTGWVKGTTYLATTSPVALTGLPLTAVEFGQQRAGDINNDNLVDVADFALMRATFGKACGDPGYDGRADYTGDCLADISDFTLLRSNFGTAGAPPP